MRFSFKALDIHSILVKIIKKKVNSRKSKSIFKGSMISCPSEQLSNIFLSEKLTQKLTDKCDRRQKVIFHFVFPAPKGVARVAVRVGQKSQKSH